MMGLAAWVKYISSTQTLRQPEQQHQITCSTLPKDQLLDLWAKYTCTKQVFTSELFLWKARGGRVNEGHVGHLKILQHVADIFRCPAVAPVDPAPWPLRLITQRKRDLFCTCLFPKQVKKSVSQGLDVGALDVWMQLKSNQTPKPYIRDRLRKWKYD